MVLSTGLYIGGKTKISNYFFRRQALNKVIYKKRLISGWGWMGGWNANEHACSFRPQRGLPTVGIPQEPVCHFDRRETYLP